MKFTRTRIRVNLRQMKWLDARTCLSPYNTQRMPIIRALLRMLCMKLVTHNVRPKRLLNM